MSNMLLVGIVLVAIIAGLTLLRVPIYVTILAAAFYLQIFVNHMNLSGAFNSMIESISKSSLLCVPFFLLAGNFMQSSSLGTRLVNLFVALLGKFRGGFAISALLSNAFFGAISGSSPAAVATFGNILYKPLERHYGAKLSLGLLASSGALSVIIPPSITLIIYGAATNTSITKLFMAGFLPGILIVILVGTYLIVKCKPIGEMDMESTEKSGRIPVGRAFLESLPVLVLPVIILGGIYGGIFTPSEAAAVAAVYAAVASLLLRDIRLSDVPKIIMGSCKTAAQLMIIIAAACVFAQAALVAQIPAAVTALFVDLGVYPFLLLLNVLLLVVGCFFETGAAVLILAPLLLETALKLGIDPIHMGIIFTVNLGIGMFTPPFGINLYVMQGVLGKKIGEISRACVPYIILYIAACLIITYVPVISMLLPNLLF